MSVYLITFFISYIFCIIGERLFNKEKNIKLAKFFLLLSVLIVAVMAGLRDNSVGSDTISYTTYYIEYGSRFKTLGEFMRFFAVYEPGFNIFSYCIGILFNHSSHWFLFWCAILIYGFTMKTLVFYQKNCSISMVWLFFLMLSCTEALNITRHYMALALAAYAFTYTFENKHKQFTLWTIIAMSFHVTAMVNFLIFVVWKIIRKRDTILFKMIIVMGTITIMFLYSDILRILSAFSFIGTKAESYINLRSFSFQINPFLIRLPFLILILVNLKEFTSRNRIDSEGNYQIDDHFGDFLFLMIIVDCIVAQMRGLGETLYRLTAFFSIFKYISYSMVIKMSPFAINRLAKRIMAYVFMIIVFMYWVVELNSGLIYPYVSDVIGIM